MLNPKDLVEQLKQLKELADAEQQADNQPSRKYLSFFPSKVQDPILKMSAKEFQYDELMPTIIIGTISASYNDEMFQYDCMGVTRLFQLSESSMHIIKLMHIESDPTVLDSENAIMQINSTLELLKKCNFSIRIVIIGRSYSNFLYDALEYLIREWHSPGEKRVQLITSGDSSDREKQEFAKSLLLRKLCTTMEFMNTNDYHPFGQFKHRGRTLVE